ncbi:hypothetical protein BJ085DRAFT_21350 [Dimargaris cristalligena]|uniref:PCI domain-containing protein n=1 Tax=Dimargaris cristalligena TaxID=215637 RepID=A0A4P9ZN41_9FUNG|nr:hypothetical protein BJ085DRAFT_21350 [Dimargaris cristalligena]|eukprot:RKP34683.1 hypothetical protein BJ085DRAFT_21350 [Dimargaris cristalligena]
MAPWNDLTVLQFDTLAAIARGDFVEAYDKRAQFEIILNRLLPSLTRAFLPVVFVVNRELSQLAIKADAQLAERGDKTGKLEDAARLVNRAFSICANDREMVRSQSRKWGVYFLAGLLFQLYFRLKTRNLCSSVTNTLQTTDLPPLEKFPLAHQIKYRYYQGLLDFYRGDLLVAEAHLLFAFTSCPAKAQSNKERILWHLIPAAMHRAALPSTALLDRFPRVRALFQPFCTALRTGNVHLFDQGLVNHERLLLKQGTYLALEETRIIALRTLLKKTYLVCGKSSRLPFQNFLKALELAGLDVEMCEAECLMASMISKGLVKGYLSHERSIFVLSNMNPFPELKKVDLSNA